MTVTGFRKTNWSLRAIALTSALIFGLGGLQFALAAEAVSGDARGQRFDPPSRVLQTSDMSVDPAQVIWMHARNMVDFTGTGLRRPTRPPMSLEPALSESTGGQWIYDPSSGPRQGLYLPSEANEFTSYAYENNSWFRLTTTGANAPPRVSDILDIIQLAGDCGAPPVGFKEMDFCWRAISADPAYDFGVMFTFWDDFDIAGYPAGTPGSPGTGSVVKNAFGQFVFNYGSIPTYVGFIICDKEPRPPTLPPIYPDDPDVGVEVTYVNGTTLALGSGTSFFAVGPPRANDYLPTVAPVGTSDATFYYDQDLDGVLGTNNRTSFVNSVVNKGNIFLHLMGFQNPDETEPNSGVDIPTSIAAADHACLCSTRNAHFQTTGDVDWVKFTVATAGPVGATLDCGSNFPAGSCLTNDTVMELRDGSGAFISSNDDISPTNCCSAISATLPAGDYFLVISDKNNDEIYDYDLIMKPLAAEVQNLKYSTTVVPAPKSVLTWDSQGAGSTYDVVRGIILSLHTGGFCPVDSTVWAPGDFTSACALPDCLFPDLTTPTFFDITNPTSAADSLFYLVRGKNTCQGIGSYNEGGNQDHDRDPQIALNISVQPCP